jgi:hypothetical protein
MEGFDFKNIQLQRPRWFVVVMTTYLGSSLLSPSPVQAQTNSETATHTTVLDPGPFVSPRAHGMAGALSTSADGADAFYYNPASIDGQMYQGKNEKKPFVRQLFFPRFGLTINENATRLNSEFEKEGAQNSAAEGAAIIKAHEGERQYARASFTPIGLFIGSLGVVPVLDQQIAAVPQNTDNSDVEFRYRTFSGAVLGASVSDPKGYLSFGGSAQAGTIEETYATKPYVDMVDQKAKAEILAANKKVYESRTQHVGLLARAPKKWNPSFSLVARDIGNTVMKAPDGTKLTIKEDLTAGVGVAPAIGKYMRFNFSIEAGHLTNKRIPASKKMRTGVEVLFGDDQGSKSLLGLRAGANSAGASYGMHLNLGLIGVEASSQAVDIGVNSERVIERRSSGVVFIDVASF